MPTQSTGFERIPPRPTRGEGHDPRRPWRNTRPRGNGSEDRRDLERGMRRLEQLLGR